MSWDVWLTENIVVLDMQIHVYENYTYTLPPVIVSVSSNVCLSKLNLDLGY